MEQCMSHLATDQTALVVFHKLLHHCLTIHIRHIDLSIYSILPDCVHICNPCQTLHHIANLQFESIYFGFLNYHFYKFVCSMFITE